VWAGHLGGGPWQIESLSDGLVLELIDHAGFAPDDELVRRTINQWHAYLQRQDQVVTTYAPLAEFEANGPPIERAFPIVIGGGTPEQAQATQDGHSADQRRIESGLVTLRLFKQARVGLYGIVKMTEDEYAGLRPMMGTRIITPLRYRLNPYFLAEAEAEDLQQFFRDFFAATRSNALVDAVARRFSSASERASIDDEIVDLVISAESIFANEPGVTGEVTFRVSNRAALFSDGAIEERRQLLAFMKKAYAARSQIVHTGKLKEKDLRSLSGDRTSAMEFANELEEVMPVALKKAIGMAASGEPFPPDWDESLLRQG
jgi:hypothetical protein